MWRWTNWSRKERDLDLNEILEKVKAVLTEVQRLKEDNQRLKQENYKLSSYVEALMLKIIPNEIFNRPISSLNLRTRSNNCLEVAHLETIGQLVTWSDTMLLRIRSFGKNSLCEVDSKLTDLGLRLGMTEEEIAAWIPPQ